jgi:diguanylate cyclase (GGDEF)-like protein
MLCFMAATDHGDTAAAIEQRVLRYLDSYFARRDLTSTSAFFDASMSGFGTGRDETAPDITEVERIYRRDLAQAPNPITYQFRFGPDIRLPAPNLGLVMAELDIETQVLDQTLILRHLRLSMVFVHQGTDWLIAHKHISLPTDAHGEDESYPIKELEARNQVLERQVAEKTRALQNAVIKIARMANTDKLTGLSNRLKIDDYLDISLKHAQEHDEPLSLILLDLDHFKRINDTHGHLCGDRVLTELASLLSANIRTTELVGRWGGEEFLVISPGMPLVAAAKQAERMRVAVRSHAFAELQQTQTASFGVACYRAGESREQLIARADLALYRAKLDGRDRVYLADENEITHAADILASERGR